MATYRTKAGDTVDWICWRRYGAIAAGVVEAVLQANPGLADHGAILPAGIPLSLPDIKAPAKRREVRLWD